MNRKIKFRAWDRERMIYNIPIDKDGKYHHCISEGFALQYDPEYIELDVMQFTGFLDKNGKEIYEGDILSYSRHDGYLMESFFMKVIWNDYYGAWGYIRSDSLLEGYICPFASHDCLREDVLQHCEVIDNIMTMIN